MNLENSNKENTGPQKVLEYDILKNVHNLLEYEDTSTFEDPKMVAYKDNVKQLLQNLVKKLDDNYKRNTFLEHEILRLKREHDFKSKKVQKELKETKDRLQTSEQKYEQLKRQRENELKKVLSFSGRIQEKLNILNRNFIEEVEPTDDREADDDGDDLFGNQDNEEAEDVSTEEI